MAAAAIPILAKVGPALLPFAQKLGPKFLSTVKNLAPKFQGKVMDMLSNKNNQEVISNIINNATTTSKNNQDPPSALTPEQIKTLLSSLVVHMPDALTTQNSAKGIFEEDFAWLQNFFVNSVQNSVLFEKLNQAGDEHCELLFSNNDYDFLHFIYYAYILIKDYLTGKRTVKTKCKFCGLATNSSAEFNRLLIFVYKNRDGVAHFFNTWFNTDLLATLKLFEGMKPVCNPFEGTYGWDLNLMMLSKLKKEGHVAPKAQYHGIIYKMEPDCSKAQKAVSIVRSFIHEGVRNFALIHSVNRVFNPEHWCGVFIDFQARVFYFYNSLAKVSQIDTSLFNMINLLLEINRQPTLTFVTNKIRQQENSKLCGMYAFHFIAEMVKKTPAERQSLFETKFNKQNSLSDDTLPSLLPQYINIPKMNGESMMHYFFTMLDSAI